MRGETKQEWGERGEGRELTGMGGGERLGGKVNGEGERKGGK